MDEGSTVTVTVNNEELVGAVTVDANGDWSVIVDQDDGGTFPLNGPVTIEAEVTDDVSGLPASAAPLDLDVDLEAPTVTIATPIAGDDNTLNIAEQEAGITISGTTTGVEDTQQVEVRLFDDGTLVPGGGGDFYLADVDENGDWSVFIPDTTLDQFSGDGSIEVTANVSDAAGNAAPEDDQSFDRDLTAPTIGIDDISGDNQIGLLDVQGDLVITGITSAEVGQPVDVTFNGVPVTGGEVTSEGVWQATVLQGTLQNIRDTALEDDGLIDEISVTANVSDVAGNPAENAAERIISANFNGPSITIDDITGDNVINAEENDDPAGITISGSTNNVPEGQDVTVTLDGTPLLPNVQTDANGDWEIIVPQGDADLPGDGETVTVTADVSDGETDALQASKSLSADFTAPVVFFDTVAEFSNPGDDITDNLLNEGAITLGGGMEFTGHATGAANGTVEIFFGAGDENPSIANVDSDGNWSRGFTGNVVNDEFPAGPGDRELDITVVAIDAAGNRSDPVTRTITLDDTPPEVRIDALESDGQALGPVMNIAESEVPLVISGTVTGAEDVTVRLNGTELSGVSVNSGGWTVTVPSDTLQALPPNATIDITASATDAAGNTGTSDPVSFDTDFTAPTIEITDTGVGTDGILNIAESDAGITVMGDVDGADGETVTVTLSGQDPAGPIIRTGPVTGGTFEVLFDGDALDGLNDWAAAEITAEVSDAAGNPATPATDGFDIDLVAPTIAFDDRPEPGFVLGVEERDSLETEGVAVTTTEPDGTDVTLTFSRDDGLGGTVADVTIDTTVSDGGTFDILLSEEQLGALQDQTTYTLDLTITDGAGNTGTDQLTVPTDFEPILTIDEIGVDGAVDLSGTEDAAITGSTLGVEDNQQVTVVITSATGQVLLDTSPGEDDINVAVVNGDWSFDVPQTVIDALEPGETFTVTANVQNAAGRAADEASVEIDAYLGSAFRILETGIAGNTVTYDVLVDLDAIETGAVQTYVGTIEFDSSILTVAPFPRETFDDAEVVREGFNPQFSLTDVVDETQLDSGLFSIFATRFGNGVTDFSTPFFSFDGEASNFEQVTRLGVSSAQADQSVNNNPAPSLGDSVSFFGTANPDTITAENVDTLIRGRGGDDSIDVSATGTNVVVFEVDQRSNGTDTVTGFTNGDTFQSDVIAFFGEADLRGAGTDVESLGNNGTLGADTGFVIFTNQLANTDAATLDTAFEGLTGEATGDEVYFLAGDGIDAALARVEVNGPDNASVEILADFEGIGDLNQLNAENVILPDSVTLSN